VGRGRKQEIRSKIFLPIFLLMKFSGKNELSEYNFSALFLPPPSALRPPPFFKEERLTNTAKLLNNWSLQNRSA
jgi:hypothetical protein